MDRTQQILIAGFLSVVLAICGSTYYAVNKLNRAIYSAGDDIPHQLIQYDQQKVREADFEASQKRAIESIRQPFLIPPTPSRQ